MSRNGSGTFTLVSGNPVVTGTVISSTWANNTLADIASALTQSLAADGQTPVTANIPMNSKKLTGLANPTTAGDALAYGGPVSGTTGAFSGAVSGTTGTFSGAVSGTTGTFSGALAGGDLTITGSTSGSVKTSATGQLYGTAIHNNSASVTGTVNQYIASGTYTPTVTSISNCSATSGNKCQYMRVGNIVTVSGSVNLTITSGGAASTEVGVSLPIASDISVQSDLGGAFTVNRATTSGAEQCSGDTANNWASLSFLSSSTGLGRIYFTFTYEVL